MADGDDRTASEGLAEPGGPGLRDNLPRHLLHPHPEFRAGHHRRRLHERPAKGGPGRQARRTVPVAFRHWRHL
jgi:hypothetical protein